MTVRRHAGRGHRAGRRDTGAPHLAIPTTTTGAPAVFGRALAYLGIATGILGVASEALRFVVEGGHGVYGVLLLVWTGAVGWRLYRLGAGPAVQVSPTSGKGPSSRLRSMPRSDRVVMPHLTPSAFTRQVINPLVSKLHTGGVVTLTVTGRRSGQPRRVPVIPVTIDDKRYLVSPYGETDWARNLRTAGQGHLRGRGTAETFHAKEIPVQERAGVIAAYRKIAGRVVDPCFAALPDPADHPVFLVE